MSSSEQKLIPFKINGRQEILPANEALQLAIELIEKAQAATGVQADLDTLTFKELPAFISALSN